jgi:hypothetical protein
MEMELIGYAVILATSIWMYMDAKTLQYNPDDHTGIGKSSPVSWLFGGLLLWIFVFPMYLFTRPKYIAGTQKAKPIANVADELQKLHQLKSSGALTAEEYEAQKSRLLSQ